MDAFRQLVKVTGIGDIVVIHYSGHGSRRYTESNPANFHDAFERAFADVVSGQNLQLPQIEGNSQQQL